MWDQKRHPACPLQSDAREADAEHARLEAEGPASHRKKDLLDKATKEVRCRATGGIGQGGCWQGVARGAAQG